MVSSTLVDDRVFRVPDWVWLILLFVAVAIYTTARIRAYMRKSEQQWRDADKSKLQSWDDDEDDRW